MIHLCDKSRRKTYLIAVAGISGSSRLGDDSLRKLAFERGGHVCRRVCAARHSHCLIYVRSAGERISDSSAETRSRAAERLDFSRMVVSLILEHYKPLLILAVVVNVDFDRASVYLVADVKIVEFAKLFKLLDRDCGDIHKTGIFILSL